MNYTVIFLGIVIKSFLVLLASWTACQFLRKKSAATTHGIWTLGFFGCLLMPAVSIVAPTGLNLRCLPQSETITSSPHSHIGWQKETQLLVDQPMERFSERQFDVVAKNEFELKPLASSLSVTPSPARESRSTTAISNNVHTPTLSLSSWVLAIWLTGVAVCLVRSLSQWITLQRMLANCIEITDDRWMRTLGRVSESMGLKTTVQLKQLPTAHSPVVVGILKPTVILPADAADWNEQRRRLVLLHELAHVKRRDILTQTVAGLVCVLHWFNPLSWFGARAMCELRELSCDDVVLRCEHRPADYADVLLDVAKSYRHRTLVTSVGMVRRQNVEDRVLAVLDRARPRVALSWPRAVGLLVTAAILVGVIGSARLQSQDVAPKATITLEKTTPNDEISAQTEDLNATRTMQIRVTDEQGTPLEEARIHAGVWYVEGYAGDKTPRDSFTDENGIVNLQIPKRLRIVRLWVSKPRFVAEFVNFSKGSHLEGKRIPSHFDFQLAKGTEISGQVVDEEGAPIAGVKVDVVIDSRHSPPTRQSAESADFIYPSPSISGRPTDSDYQNSGPMLTDEMGRWKLTTAPAAPHGDDHGIRVRLRHPQYLGDVGHGDLQQKQNVTVAMLRNGTAKITLPRGIEVVGFVQDEAGNPVNKGIVVWSDHPYFGGDAVFESQIEETGVFQTPPLAEGKYPITVLAPGYQPDRRVIKVNQSMEAPVFKLKPGKSLSIHVVNQDGESVPNPSVNIDGWRGANSLYNNKHSSITDSRIPRQGNSEGIFRWDWAPADAVTYQVYAKGYDFRSVALIPKDKPHVVKLTQPLIATGIVTDSKTGKPVEDFTAIPITEYSPGDLMTRFRQATPGTSGRYQLELSQSGGLDYRYRIRVESVGYRTVISEKSFGPNDGNIKIDLSLDPAPRREGKVVDSRGVSVSNAQVVLASPSTTPIMSNGKPQLGGGGRSVATGVDGQFQLAATSEPIRLRVLHASGFAEVPRQLDEPLGEIQIQPWAGITGKLVQDGKPMAEQGIYFSPLIKRRAGEPRYQDTYYTATDAAGNFEFKRLPPGPGFVRARLSPFQDSPLTASPSIPLDLKAGETRSVPMGRFRSDRHGQSFG